mmetsp:Transcript_39552/g.55736  ORF Transcript_39552/g.55736 Transcript_39552/m.55736 type:complete len:175 (-) Transcript_39552:375-899(-)|eukprot:CAMPEP_0202443252 /NCGR_PEP_ID=MMETSP1360-20130828/2589_1 /ASSEMBLY_ACC=CAM_ASM_000848 /TAXON_ID=515479 /ORGANISM="Licmophora paradoxa, Strain CCMP2313" /LENGTH=174 /DNA_ID=CAMNT_0049058901 /DNA_START=32 /DNA_END=556 /DNA_ORIENTATION=-
MRIDISTICALLLVSGANGFAAPYRRSQHSNSLTAVRSAAKESESTESAAEGDTPQDNDAETAAVQEHEAWMEQVQSEEIQEVRAELIYKYVQLGKGQEEAENEVDKFLSDPEQSKQYLEMRRYAKAQADELGPELVLQLGGAFVIGLSATVIPKYISAYKSVYPDGNGPIPFL